MFWHGLVWTPLWGRHVCIMPQGWFMGGGGMLVALFVILFFVLLFLALAPQRSSWRYLGFREEDPLEILKRRYARGEITREEYERMREDLKR